MGTQDASAPLQEEHECIERAQAGDKAAFGQLVERYQRLMVSVAYHQGLDLAAAQDAAQETCLRAWLALPRFKESSGSLRAWLCRIAINVAIDMQRRARFTQPLDERWPDDAGDVAGQAEKDWQAQAVRRALSQLPPASRAALVLREYEGLSYAEISAALGIPQGTVMSRLNYARERLRALLSGVDEAA